MEWDFKFDSSGDMVINNLKQIDIVQGVDKAKQDLEHVIKCVTGSDAFNPSFGVDWIKIKRLKLNKELIKHEISKSLKKYDKLKSIDRIEISELDGNRNIRIKLYLTLDEDKIYSEVVV